MSSGQVFVKLGLVEPYGSAAPDSWIQAWSNFLNSAKNTKGVTANSSESSVPDKKSQIKTSLLQKYRTSSDKSINATAAKFHGEDLMGVMYIEVTCASDLPPERNGEFAEHTNAQLVSTHNHWCTIIPVNMTY